MTNDRPCGLFLYNNTHDTSHASSTVKPRKLELRLFEIIDNSN